MRVNLVLGWALAGWVMAGGAVLAGKAPAAEKESTKPVPRAILPEQKAREFGRLLADLRPLMEGKKYDEAVVVCRKLIATLPEVPLGHYNLACAFAQLGKTDEAVAALTAAVDLGYYDVAHLQKDEDLSAIRGDKRFDELVEKAKVNERAGGGRYEKSEELQGLKTLEGFPDGGFRWRLRMGPDATKDKPERLIVWLHPEGATMNREVEASAPRLIKCGYALLVFTQKPLAYWAGADGEKVAKSVEDAAKAEGIDAKRPILMGCASGGQLALELWSRKPGEYGGLIVQSAYPVRVVSKIQLGPMRVPQDAAVKTVPLFALVGSEDSGARIWKTAGPDFLRAGVPLVLRGVPGRGHDWLLGDVQWTELEKWLADVAAGKCPSDPVPPLPEGKKAGGEKAPAEKTPAEKAPDEKGPATKAPAEKTPAGETKPKG